MNSSSELKKDKKELNGVEIKGQLKNLKNDYFLTKSIL